MVRSKDPPLLKVRVSFESTRLSPQHLIDAYDRVMPTFGALARGRTAAVSRLPH